jgi:hypothetical protein
MGEGIRLTDNALVSVSRIPYSAPRIAYSASRISVRLTQLVADLHSVVSLLGHSQADIHSQPRV